MIVFDRVSVRPDDSDGPPILRDVSLTLGEPKIALIGANGSGKSTLARLINGLALPSSGRVLVEDLDVAEDAARVRRLVGFVFTDPAAQLVMPTPIEDVALSLRRQHRDRTTRRQAAQRVLAGYGLAELADRSVYTLSGGQRQLVALAGVLALAPRIVVADEPTTLLDLRNSALVGDLLLSLDQQVVVATHDLELARRCDRALLIDSGTVVFDGDPAEAVTRYRNSALGGVPDGGLPDGPRQ